MIFYYEGHNMRYFDSKGSFVPHVSFNVNFYGGKLFNQYRPQTEVGLILMKLDQNICLDDVLDELKPLPYNDDL